MIQAPMLPMSLLASFAMPLLLCVLQTGLVLDDTTNYAVWNQLDTPPTTALLQLLPIT